MVILIGYKTIGEETIFMTYNYVLNVFLLSYKYFEEIQMQRTVLATYVHVHVHVLQVSEGINC